jgi:hypothetical protein
VKFAFGVAKLVPSVAGLFLGIADRQRRKNEAEGGEDDAE